MRGQVSGPGPRRVRSTTPRPLVNRYLCQYPSPGPGLIKSCRHRHLETFRVEENSVRSLLKAKIDTRGDELKIDINRNANTQDQRGPQTQGLILTRDRCRDTWNNLIGPRHLSTTPRVLCNGRMKGVARRGIRAENPSRKFEDPSSRDIGHRGPRWSTTPLAGVNRKGPSLEPPRMECPCLELRASEPPHGRMVNMEYVASNCRHNIAIGGVTKRQIADSAVVFGKMLPK